LNQNEIIAFKGTCANCFDNYALVLVYYANYMLCIIPYNLFLQRFLDFPANLLLVLLPLIPIVALRIVGERKKNMPKIKVIRIGIMFGLVFASAVVIPTTLFHVFFARYPAQGLDLSWLVFMAPLDLTMMGIFLWFGWRYRIYSAMSPKATIGDESHENSSMQDTCNG